MPLEKSHMKLFLILFGSFIISASIWRIKWILWEFCDVQGEGDIVSDLDCITFSVLLLLISLHTLQLNAAASYKFQDKKGWNIVALFTGLLTTFLKAHLADAVKTGYEQLAWTKAQNELVLNCRLLIVTLNKKLKGPCGYIPFVERTWLCSSIIWDLRVMNYDCKEKFWSRTIWLRLIITESVQHFVFEFESHTKMNT